MPKAKTPKPPPPPAYDVQFGLRWPPHVPELNRRFVAARWNTGTVSQYEHRKWIIERMWGNDPDKYEVNFWSERRLKAVCEHNFVIMMGPASSAKTTDLAADAVEYWLEDPGNTAVMVCSTTKDMLRKRIWYQIVRLWRSLPGSEDCRQPDYKGVLTDTNCMIRWRDGDMANGIFGFAVADGPVEEAINNLIGIHTKRVFLILDEMQGINKAIMGPNCLGNLVKNPESKFVGMGNPTSMNSMLCEYIAPIDGWNSVVECETPEWEIDPGPYRGKGIGLFFDGRKSPAYLDPEWGKRRPWMLQKEQVDYEIEKYGVDSPQVRTMTIGWPPNVGTDNTVLDVSIIEKFHCRDKAHWTSGYNDGAALDPAFAEGGDNKVLQFFRYGLVNDMLGNRWVIEFGESYEVPIDTKSGETVEYQIVNYCREKCQSKGIRAEEFGMDMTGIGRGLCMIFRKEWGPIIGVEFGGMASDELVEAGGKTGREVFDRRVSELNIMLRRFANANGIRGLPAQAEKEACIRLTTQKIKHKVETKADMKKRLGKSPDALDAVCIAVDMARQMGAYPGASGPAVAVQEADIRRQQYESDQRFDESASAEADDWEPYANMML